VGGYQTGELEAYAKFLRREVTLVLLSDHRGTDSTDELAEMLGVTFGGVVDGRVTRLAEHQIASGISDLDWGVGAAVTAYDGNRVEILGWVNDSVPVMGVVKEPKARVFSFGDTNAPEWVPQPFIDNLLAWGL